MNDVSHESQMPRQARHDKEWLWLTVTMLTADG